MVPPRCQGAGCVISPRHDPIQPEQVIFICERSFGALWDDVLAPPNYGVSPQMRVSIFWSKPLLSWMNHLIFQIFIIETNMSFLGTVRCFFLTPFSHRSVWAGKNNSTGPEPWETRELFAPWILDEVMGKLNLLPQSGWYYSLGSVGTQLFMTLSESMFAAPVWKTKCALCQWLSCGRFYLQNCRPVKIIY